MPTTVVFQNNHIGQIDNVAGKVVISNQTITVGGGAVHVSPLVVGDGIHGKRHVNLEGEVDGVSFRGPGQLQILQGLKAGVDVLADQNLLDHVTIELKDSSLSIGLQGAVQLNLPMMITVTAPAISSIKLAGSGTVVYENCQVPALRCTVSGSGEVMLDGRAERIRARVSGSGKIDATRFITQDADLTVSGSGKLLAHASDTAEVVVSGSGKAVIHGMPAHKRAETSGSGKVKWA